MEALLTALAGPGPRPWPHFLGSNFNQLIRQMLEGCQEKNFLLSVQNAHCFNVCFFQLNGRVKSVVFSKKFPQSNFLWVFMTLSNHSEVRALLILPPAFSIKFILLKNHIDHILILYEPQVVHNQEIKLILNIYN